MNKKCGTDTGMYDGTGRTEGNSKTKHTATGQIHIWLRMTLQINEERMNYLIYWSGTICYLHGKVLDSILNLLNV